MLHLKCCDSITVFQAEVLCTPLSNRGARRASTFASQSPCAAPKGKVGFPRVDRFDVTYHQTRNQDSKNKTSPKSTFLTLAVLSSMTKPESGSKEWRPGQVIAVRAIPTKVPLMDRLHFVLLLNISHYAIRNQTSSC